METMGQFMVNINLPDLIDDNFESLIPDHRIYIDQLMNQGTINTYSLAADRSKLWISFNCRNEREVAKYINNFPIKDYITYEISPLLFHNTSQILFPTISLN